MSIDEITPEQKAILSEHNLHTYPTIQELSASKGTTNSGNTQVKSVKSESGKLDFSFHGEMGAKSFDSQDGVFAGMDQCITILKRLDEIIARSTFFGNFGLQNTLQPDMGVGE